MTPTHPRALAPAWRLSPRHLLVLVLMLFAFGMAGLVSRVVFERLPHLEDEMAYLFQARTLAGGHLVIDSPVPARPYWQPFLVDQGGTRFGKYTLGYPIQLMFGVLMGEAWVVNALLAALGVAVAYRLGHILSEDTGAFAAALTAFSPMALLLNGTLMGHSGALVCSGLFMGACWQIVRHARQPRPGLWRWGLLGGAALGLLVITRPLTAIGIAAPFAAWCAWQTLIAVLQGAGVITQGAGTVTQDTGAITQAGASGAESETRGADRAAARTHAIGLLRGFVPLTLVAAGFALLIPIYNFAATGSPTTNLYTLVWPYDRIGFGAGGDYGRSGHTLERAVRHTRFDLSLTAADLFGWQAEPINGPVPASAQAMVAALPALELNHYTVQSGMVRADLFDHFTVQSDYYPVIGLSWILPLLGILFAFGRRSPLILVWIALGVLLIAIPYGIDNGNPTRDSRVAWVIIIAVLGMAALPTLLLRRPREQFAYLLVAAALSLVLAHMTYWIGSQRYSTRYYYEALLSASIIGALPLAWLARRHVFSHSLRLPVYVAVGALLVYTHYSYSIPRISALYGFNLIDRSLLAQVEQRRIGDAPLLVLINGDTTRWRAYAALSSQTSPYLDSPIVAARVANTAERQAALDRFPDRQVIELDGVDNLAWFQDSPPAVIPTPMPR